MARVAVLLGGLSGERPVSLVSGRECGAALRRLGHEVFEVDPQDADWIDTLATLNPDVVFNALHGEYGEDGRAQGVLEQSMGNVIAGRMTPQEAVTDAHNKIVQIFEEGGIM